MSEKKDLGQFLTNPIIAEFMINIGTSQNKNIEKILDPSTGPGTFLKFVDNKQYDITAFEIDKKMIEQFNSNIKSKCNLKNEDYLVADLEPKYDFIICNPPYNKFQKIPNRDYIISEFNNNYGVKLSGYSNYCVYFLIKSLNELSTNGICVYIIPYEFLNCGYGEIIKKYLLEKKVLKSIIKFDNSIKLFDDATTTSCILVTENSINNNVDFVNIKDLKEIQEYNGVFSNVKNYRYDELDYKEKWINYFKEETSAIYKNLIQFKKIGQVKRGIATGSNSYFTLNKEKISKYNLSKEVCMPCITKSPDVKQIKFNQKQFDELYNNNKAVYIFNGVNSIKKNDYDYIKYGEDMEIDKLYLTSHRTPWFSVEDKKAAPIWISVFSRNRLKVIRNELMIHNLTAFHGIYFDKLSESDINVMFCYLLTPIGQEILYMNKREYGEGLDKFEPNDLNNASVLDIRILNDQDKEEVLKVYENIENNTNENISRLNVIFKKYLV